MALFEGPIQDLVDELGRLPGVGPKSAQRIAFHLLKVAKEDALRLARSIVEVTEQTVVCEVCFNITTALRCSICSDGRRDQTVVCVVEDPRDIVAIERTREFRGRYHVLGGALNPIEGVGPEQLRVPRSCSARASTPTASPRSSSARTRTSRATPPRCTSPDSSNHSGSPSRALRAVSPSGAILSTPTSSRSAARSKEGERSSPERVRR